MTVQKFTIQELNNEEWRDVVGYEGTYSVSSLGRIRRDVGGKGLCRAGRILKSYPVKKRYVQIKLTLNGVPTVTTVHKLVARAFIGECPEGMQVNHKDPKTGKHDNRASNLEYSTPQDNIRHAVNNGLMATGDRNGSRTKPERLSRGDNHHSCSQPERLARGDRHGRTKIPDARLPHVFELRRKGLTQREIGDIMGVTNAQISVILSGRKRKVVVI